MLNLNKIKHSKIIGFGSEIEFYLKVVICCVITQQFFYWILGNVSPNVIEQILLYWTIGSLSFYSIGLIIEKGIKRNKPLAEHLTIRAAKVRKQLYPSFTAKSIAIGEFKALITVTILLFIAPEVHRGNSIVLNFGWFSCEL